jgi:hypothetical protein
MDVTIPTDPSLSNPLPEAVIVAIDSEYQGTQTLSVQTAARVEEHTLAVQVYRSTTIPDLPPDFDLDKYLPTTPEKYGRYCQKVIPRPMKVLTPDLSPARMILDLYELNEIQVRSRLQGLSKDGQIDPFSEWQPANAKWNERANRFDLPAITLVIVGHFLRADFFRIFGRGFLATLRPHPFQKRSDVVVRSRKLIAFVEQTRKRTIHDPILEYLVAGDNAYALRVKMRDTTLPYGKGRLEDHSQTFVGIGKSETLSEEDKKHMSETFRKRPTDTYGYAMVDAVNTLLVYEAMVAKDREISRAFGLPE